MNIAIDTNVFIHLFNPENNKDSHIDQLLSHLAKQNCGLCVDTTSKIANEYEEKLDPIVKKAEDTRIQIYILRYWMTYCTRIPVDTDPTDLLMHRIKQVIPEDELVDRAFIYVSCKGDCCLVTNDGEHILPRRKEIRSKTRGFRGNNSVIKSSREAVPHLVTGDAAAIGKGG